MEMYTTNWAMLLWQIVILAAVVFIGYKVFKKLRKW
jgi:hypothetical protein